MYIYRLAPRVYIYIQVEPFVKIPKTEEGYLWRVFVNYHLHVYNSVGGLVLKFVQEKHMRVENTSQSFIALMSTSSISDSNKPMERNG